MKNLSCEYLRRLGYNAMFPVRDSMGIDYIYTKDRDNNRNLLAIKTDILDDNTKNSLLKNSIQFDNGISCLRNIPDNDNKQVYIKNVIDSMIDAGAAIQKISYLAKLMYNLPGDLRTNGTFEFVIIKP